MHFILNMLGIFIVILFVFLCSPNKKKNKMETNRYSHHIGAFYYVVYVRHEIGQYYH